MARSSFIIPHSTSVVEGSIGRRRPSIDKARREEELLDWWIFLDRWYDYVFKLNAQHVSSICHFLSLRHINLHCQGNALSYLQTKCVQEEFEITINDVKVLLVGIITTAVIPGIQRENPTYISPSLIFPLVQHQHPLSRQRKRSIRNYRSRVTLRAIIVVIHFMHESIANHLQVLRFQFPQRKRRRPTSAQRSS